MTLFQIPPDTFVLDLAIVLVRAGSVEARLQEAQRKKREGIKAAGEGSPPPGMWRRVAGEK